MKISRLLLITALVGALITGCDNKNKVHIQGEYSGDKGKYLYLGRVDVDVPVFIDSVKISASGNFKTSIEANQPEFYTLGFSENDFITIIGYPGDRITLSFNGENLKDDFSVEGSEETEDVRQLDIKLDETLARLDSVVNLFEALPEGAEYDEQRSELEAEYLSIIKAQRMHNIGFIIENLKSFASIKALYQRLDETAYVLYQPTDAQYLKLVTDTLGKYYPGSRQVRALKQNLDNELAELNRSRITQIAEESATTDLDLNLSDISGKRVKLSSLTSENYVLLTFWSAQSRECITNNIQLKEY